MFAKHLDPKRLRLAPLIAAWLLACSGGDGSGDGGSGGGSGGSGGSGAQNRCDGWQPVLSCYQASSANCVESYGEGNSQEYVNAQCGADGAVLGQGCPRDGLFAYCVFPGENPLVFYCYGDEAACQAFTQTCSDGAGTMCGP